MKEITNGLIYYGDPYDAKNNANPEFYLSHSCDEWVIGNLEAAKGFLEDLQKTIKQVEELEKE